MCNSIVLRHATPAQNVPSILAGGLQVAKARGRRCIWLHSKGRTPWALAHVAERHEVPVDQLAVFTVLIPRQWLRRHSSGVWCAPFDVPPCQIISVRLPFAAAAAAAG